jgi:heptosyltransferase-3
VKRIQALGRALLMGLIRLFFSPAPVPAPRIDAGAIRRVLVVRTDTRVGNVLLTTPLVRALRRGLPQARLDWLVASGKQVLVEGLADRLIPFDKKQFFRAPLRFWRSLGQLRLERYDLVIEAGHWHTFSFTSLWLARWTGAPIRVGHARGLADHFLTHPVEKDPAVVRDVASKLELLAPLGLAPAGEELETTVDRAPQVGLEADSIVALAEGRQVVALNPGARKPDHRWPARAFGELARRLRDELGVTPLVLWGPGEEPIARAVVEASCGAALYAPSTDLPLLAALFRRSAVVVTNDTGPMHLAVASGAPVVATLVADDGARWSHAGRFVGVAVKEGTPEEVERVAAAVAGLLGAKERALA